MSDCALTILILCRNEEGSIAHCVGEAQGFWSAAALPGRCWWWTTAALALLVSFALLAGVFYETVGLTAGGRLQ